MKLLAKFSLIFVLIFGLGAAIAGKVCYDFLRRDAREQVVDQASLMMQSAAATRSYTNAQIKPLIGIRRGREFHPQWVPAYAATQTFALIHADNPDYSYKEATLNPTNPRNRAADWEADVIGYFRGSPGAKHFSGERMTPTGQSLYVAHPIVVQRTCLGCHSTPAAAPPAMVRRYGGDNGFGWRIGETIGAQIVSVPMSVPLARADAGFHVLMGSLGIVAVVTLIVLNLLLAFVVIRPVSRLASNADEISKGNLEVAEIPAKGRDEIAVLAESVNRMHRSLVTAMKLLRAR